MRGFIAQRQLALAGVAIIGVGGSLAVTARNKPHAAVLPQAEGSYTALAASTGAGIVGETTACGVRIHRITQGIANPLLPCGTRLYVGYQGRHVLVSVIDHQLQKEGHGFELTPALAQRLGLRGVKRIQWSYVAPA